MSNLLPNTQVLLDYLELHPKAREEDRKSLLSQMEYTAQKMIGMATAQDPVIDQLNAITNGIRSKINIATTFDSMYQLIFTLRREAEKAQNLKSRSNQSLLSETLHALADLIITELNDNDEFKQILQTLQSDKIKKAKYVIDCIDLYHGNDIVKANNDYNKILLILADLGDLKSINEAMQRVNEATQRKLLPSFYICPGTNDLFEMDMKKNKTGKVDNPDCLNTGSQAAPLCLQLKFFEWLYKKEFQPITVVSFEEFKKRAITKGEEEKKYAHQTAKEGLQTLSEHEDDEDNDADIEPSIVATVQPATNATSKQTGFLNDLMNTFVAPTASVAPQSIFAKQLVSSTPPPSPTLVAAPSVPDVSNQPPSSPPPMR